MKINAIKAQIQRNKCRFDSNQMTIKVYYDQNEELYAKLDKLKREKKDPLEEWCKTHPNDLECRIHDY